MHILGLGAIAVDDLLTLDHHPLPDSKMPVRARRREGGGLCATALVAAQRLGVQTAFAGVLGDDELSRFSLDALQCEGVDTSRVRIQDGARPRYSVILVSQNDGGRCILSSKEGVVPLRASDFQAEWLDDCACLFADHCEAEAGLVAAKAARARGIPVVADIERADTTEIVELMKQVTHLIVGHDFARRLTNSKRPRHIRSVLTALEEFCPHFKMVCVTNGADGCDVEYKDPENTQCRLGAFPVQVLDTTGCGDAFHGAFAASLVQGFSDYECLVRASACAALNATQPGGRGGLPSRDELEAFLRERQGA